MTEAEIQDTVRQFYLNLTDVIVETLKALTISPEELRKRVRLINPEKCLQYIQPGQTVIVMASHQANWEWLQLASKLHLACPVDAIYRPLSNAFFNRLMLAIRTRFGSHPVPMQKLPRELSGRKDITRIVALVADQSPAPEMAYWTTFLNQDTGFFIGAAKIARRTGYPILFAGMNRVRRGYYEVYFEQLPGNLPDSGIIEAYARMVEKGIEVQPANWLWSHKRWKHRRPERSIFKDQ